MKDRTAEPMKILVALLSIGFAGTERHAVELANEPAHEVAIPLRRRPPEPNRRAAYAMLRGGILPRIPVFLALRSMLVLALWYALIKFRPEIVHAHHERAVRIASRHSGRIPVPGAVHVHFSARDFMRCDGVIGLTAAELSAIPPTFAGVVAVIDMSAFGVVQRVRAIWAVCEKAIAACASGHSAADRQYNQ